MKIVHINQLLDEDAGAAQSPKPRDCDEEAAKYDRYREEWNRDYQRTRAKEREEERNRTLFAIEIHFENLDEALAARRELIAAGYEFGIRPEIDPYSKAVFTEVLRSSYAGLTADALWDQLQAIVEPMGGMVDNGGLIEDPTLERRLHRLQ